MRTHLVADSACCSRANAAQADGHAPDRPSFSPLNQTLAAITGLRDPLHEARRVQPLDVLASADRDVRINAPRLLNALTFTSAEEALVFAETLATHRRALQELETLAVQRAHRLGTSPLPFGQENKA